MRVAVEEAAYDDEDPLGARVRLLEGFVSRTEIADCAQVALQWLGDVLNLTKSICLVRPAGEQSLFVVAAHGFAGSASASFAVSREDWANPLVTAFTHRKELFFPAPHSAADRRRRPSTPFEDGAFHVVPLGVMGFSEEVFGLLLVGGAAPLRTELHWFTNLFSQKVDQLLRHQALTDGDRKQGRERSLLHSIINAVTDAVERARAGDGTIDVAAAEDALQRKAVDYDREGDRHYDYISAWIKATRGSDPDASLYYLAVMLEGGEDPRFIARRMVIFASEDIGNADPMALPVAVAAAEALDRVGMPEAALNLGHAATYLALAPKSDAAKRGIGAAMAEVREHGAKPPPDYLRDAHYPGAKKLGRGVGYTHPQKDPEAAADQEYMPEGLEGRRFYEP